MCCFSRPIEIVSNTQLFTRALPDGRQALAYQMSVAATEDLAMVLPLPVPPNAPEDAVSFVDLSGYPTLFEDLNRALPIFTRPRGAVSAGAIPESPPKKLQVHDVGDFEASFVPTVRDFDRLDARFRLPDDVWEGLPEYADYGFAVFKLRGFGGWFTRLFQRKQEKRVHPMAFTFPRRDLDRLFFPTLHIHDGEAHENARFDHSLFWQAPDSDEPLRADPDVVARNVDIARSMGLLTGERPLFRRRMAGVLPNRDTWI